MNDDLIARLQLGINQSEPWISLDLSCDLKPMNKVFQFPEAKMEYFPDHEVPTHVIVWTKGSLHVFDYHSINWIQERKP